MTIADTRGEPAWAKIVSCRRERKLGRAQEHTGFLFVMLGEKHVIGIEILHVGDSFEPGLARFHSQHRLGSDIARLARKKLRRGIVLNAGTRGLVSLPALL